MRRKQHTTLNVWSFNHRGRPAYDSDSNSDSGGASDVHADEVADPRDARLMREMDLSSRYEAVQYRPNPWSIARINAASRTSFLKPALPPTPGPARSPRSKPIVKAFEKQEKRGPRGVQSTVRDVRNPGDNSVDAAGVDKPCAAERDNSSAKESSQNTVRGCPQRTELPESPSPAHKPQIGSAMCATEALEEEKPAHISTFSDRFTQSAHARPLEARRIFTTHQATRSSPDAHQSALDVSYHAVRDRLTFHASSPGPRSHLSASGETHSNPDN